MHQLNRGGVYPQAETVQNLALKIFDGGFSVEEANQEGVCVQELPSDQRDSEPLPTSTQLRGYETYKEFNRRNCEGIAMRCCFDDACDIVHGTLSHSHLLMVLLCLQKGAEWQMPERWAQMPVTRRKENHS